MKVSTTSLPGVLIIEPDVHQDDRGFFFENYNQKLYADRGLPERFVQDNQSRSKLGTLRGLHAQLSRPQGKLVRIVQGKVFDVAVDIRRGSPTYKQWVGVILSAENFLQCYIPPGFAHGFCVLSETAEMEYKVTDYYDPSGELHLLWNDPDLAIQWPLKDPILSPKDQSAVRLQAVERLLPVYHPEK
jgi:dTDP-4-dehydrorhamnose 3,5-epimerase